MSFDPDEWENAILANQDDIINAMLIKIIEKTDIEPGYKQYLIHGLIDCWYEYLIKNNRLSTLCVILKHINFACRIEAFAYAVSHNNIQALAVLNECRFIPHDIPYDNPPIVQAVKANQIEAVELLLQNHSYQSEYPRYIEPLIIAVNAGYTSIIHCLLKQPCVSVAIAIPQKISDTHTRSLLECAIVSPNSNLEIIDAILAHRTSRDMSPECYQRAIEKCQQYNKMDYLACIEQYPIPKTHFGPRQNLNPLRAMALINMPSVSNPLPPIPANRIEPWPSLEEHFARNQLMRRMDLAPMEPWPSLEEHVARNRVMRRMDLATVRGNSSDIARSSKNEHHTDNKPLIPSFIIMLLTSQLTITVFALTLVASIILLSTVACSLISYVSFSTTAALAVIGLCGSWKAADYLPRSNSTDIDSSETPSLLPL